MPPKKNHGRGTWVTASPVTPPPKRLPCDGGIWSGGEGADRVVGGPQELFEGVKGGVGDGAEPRVHRLQLRPLAPELVSPRRP